MLYNLYILLLQLPIGTRNPDDIDPIDLTRPFDVIVYIILPVLLIVFYILWRKNKKKRDKK
ncbi:adenylosuccinate synthetase [Flavobacteriaceae bacterium F89]|uniref:Adenylosuccinate synthetase n=1 Tax=Cerina litoralis TaxID=2874477 RepID=A0AAE3EXR1_9FLAO|nr:adenylosuccinate synthetase [Cerina litoralis]MCG2462198.1 adenylosuccinate synthetase [Cerina litoralis]